MRWRLPMRLNAADDRPLDPVQAWTVERERVHRARTLRLVLPVVPPVLVLLLIIGGVVAVPRGLPEIALWLIMAALYGRMWIFLIRDARRLADEAAAIDRHFRDMIGDGAFDADVAITLPGSDARIGSSSAREGSVVAVVGRPIDEHDASAQRFPLTAVGEVRARLDRYMARVRPSAVVCSAASGADLLALDVAEARRVRSRVVLPYGRARYRQIVVTNRPGTWGPLFDRILGTLPSEDVIVLAVGNGDAAENAGAAAEAVNATILDHATMLAAAVTPAARGASGTATDHATSGAPGAEGGEPGVVALLVWEGGSAELASGAADPVAGFRAQAERRGIRVDQILTK